MNSTVKPKSQATMMVPVTTMEEVPVLSDDERNALVVSLREGETRMAAGEFVAHDPDTFVDRLMELRAEAQRKKAV